MSARIPALIAVMVTAALVACGGSSTPAVSVTRLPAVTTVQSAAAALHATRLTECGPAALGGVVDSSTAYLGSERIGINTFASTAARDAWKKDAASLGVVVFAEGTDWAAYKATSQTATGCN